MKHHSKTSAAPDNLFVVCEDCKKLSNEASAAFHTIVAKALYVTKRTRLNISLVIAFLTMLVRSPNIEDWEKLRHLMEYLRGDRERPLILGRDNEGVLMWYINALFAVHPNMRGHTSGGMTIGRGFPIYVSTKQKLNTKSLTESELVGVDDMMPIILCGLAISCYHRDMESLRTLCCKTIRVQSYLRRTVKPPVGNVQGISTFATFSS